MIFIFCVSLTFPADRNYYYPIYIIEYNNLWNKMEAALMRLPGPLQFYHGLVIGKLSSARMSGKP